MRHIYVAVFLMLISFHFVFSGTFTPVDIRKGANMGFVDKVPEDGKGGWTDQGKGNSLAGFPVGDRKFCGIPFKVIDPDNNNGKSCIVLRGKERPNFPKRAIIPLDKAVKAQSIYFLHTFGWSGEGNIMVYRIKYSDGKKAYIDVVNDYNIGGWWGPEDLSNAKVAWRGANTMFNNIGVYITSWENPHPDKKISEIAVQSEEKGVPAIIGITLSKKPAVKMRKTEQKAVIDNVDTSDWYAFKLPIDNIDSPTPFNEKVYGWHKPAGKFGAVKVKGKNFIFENNGNKAKFWGIGLGGTGIYPMKSDAPYMAARIAKYGFNLVRFHSLDGTLMKSSEKNSGTGSNINEKRLERLDYFIYQLKKQGIYTCFNFWYTPEIGSEDGIAEHDKIANLCNEYLFVDEKAQKYYLKFVDKILNHRNPYTKMSYLEDPALAFAGVINESDMFYNTVDNMTPAHRKMLKTQWNEFIINKYGSIAKALQAWNLEGQTKANHKGDESQSLELLSVYTLGNTPSNLIKRAIDQAFFYRKLQSEWYMKVYNKYHNKGNLLWNGSNWTSSNWLEGVNLSQQNNMDFIDKHTYWDHPHGGWTMDIITFNNKSVLSSPKVNLMNCAFSQLDKKPFFVTEWACATPNEYQTEEGPVISSYAALQGWDGMVVFCTGSADWTGRIGTNLFEIFDNPARTILHSIASMIFVRGDVNESDYVYKNVIQPEGNLFDPKRGREFQKSSEDESAGSMMYVGWKDVNEVPGEWKAIGKIGMGFDGEKIKKTKEAENCWDKEKKIIKSLTNELEWRYGEKIFLLDTSETKGIHGFLKGKTHNLSDVTIKAEAGFAGVYITALDNCPIPESEHLAVFAVGRTRNKGMKYQKKGKEWSIAERGGAPLITEPVKLEISFPTNVRKWESTRLDLNYHVWKTKTKLVKNNNEGTAVFKVDTGKARTPVFEIKAVK